MPRKTKEPLLSETEVQAIRDKPRYHGSSSSISSPIKLSAPLPSWSHQDYLEMVYPNRAKGKRNKDNQSNKV